MQIINEIYGVPFRRIKFRYYKSHISNTYNDMQEIIITGLGHPYKDDEFDSTRLIRIHNVSTYKYVRVTRKIGFIKLFTSLVH